MPTFGRPIAMATALVWLALPGAAPWAATTLAQAPCVPTSGNACQALTGSGKTATLRTFTFNLPGAKTVLAAFHGSLVCTNAAAVDNLVIVESQIVTGNGPVNATGPGALSQAAALSPQLADGNPSFATFNLASTRVIDYSSGGAKTIRLKIRQVIVPTGVTCYPYNSSFSATVTP